MHRSAPTGGGSGDSLRALLVFVAAIVFVDTSFYAAITPLLPDLSREFGLSKAGAGLLAAAYPAGTFAGSLPGGWLAARGGVRVTVLTGLSLMTVASVAFAFAGSAMVLDVARFVQGFGGAASWAGAFGWLIGAAPGDQRGRLIGSAMGAAIGGGLFGPVLGALADVAGHAVVFCGVAVVGVGLMVWALRTPSPSAAGNGSLRVLWRAIRHPRIVAAMWLVAIPGLLFGTLSVLAPLRLDTLGAGAGVIAAAFLVAAGIEAVVNPYVGRIADRRGRVGPSLVGLGGATLVMVLLPWPARAWLLVALIIVAAPLIGILWTPSMALLSDGAEALGIDQGLAFALMNLAWAVGQTAGNAGSARLAQWAGDPVPYLLLAAVCAATFGILRAGARRSRAAV